MNITVNGQCRELNSEITITGLLEIMQLTGKRLAVEVNGEIVPRGNHSAHTLKDDDTIEIVHAIGGGSI
ncbi:Sulfur carrier protein ThiS [hydrothermal vent metagenome]|uniref:Sulfur carrier protein ThiS n=1 Tax=hydrothermal vent metagenome TaxID=652676 RepID=A0A3B0ZL94_9ZZZZ